MTVKRGDCEPGSDMWSPSDFRASSLPGGRRQEAGGRLRGDDSSLSQNSEFPLRLKQGGEWVICWEPLHQPH